MSHPLMCFISGDTPKGSVVKYATQQANMVPLNHTHPLQQQLAHDDVLLWRFLVLLCQQNGVVVPSDISDLLMNHSMTTPSEPLRGVGVGGATDEQNSEMIGDLRQLLLAGRKKVNALQAKLILGVVFD